MTASNKDDTTKRVSDWGIPGTYVSKGLESDLFGGFAPPSD